MFVLLSVSMYAQERHSRNLGRHSRNLGSLALPAVEHLDELLEADDVAHAHRRVHRDEVVQVVLRLGRLQIGEERAKKVVPRLRGFRLPAPSCRGK